jgi:3-oxoadipate enol-lactonase
MTAASDLTGSAHSSIASCRKTSSRLHAKMGIGDEEYVEVEGINYYTLLEEPDNGNEDAPTALLVHALMSNLHMWDATSEALRAQGYRVLRYEHPGHHHTPPQRGCKAEYHMDDITRHAHRIVQERTGQSRIKALIGCSIGGTIAFRYALLFPDDVESIIALASPGIKSPEVAHKLWAQRIQLFEEDLKSGDDNLCRQTVARWIPGERPEDDAVRRECLRHVKTCNIQGYKLLADTIRDYDYSDQVADIGKVKTLVIAGEEDQAGPASVLREVAEKISGAEFVVMEKTGHLPPLQKPDEFSEIMLRFLEKA